MNHRKQMPANGISTAAARTLPSEPSTHCAPGWAPSGSAVWISAIATPNSTANNTPARPAARGVDSRRTSRSGRSVVT